MTMRYADAQTLPFWGPAVAPRHIGRSPGLVDEDEPVRVEVGLTVEPGFPPRQDVGTILLRGMRRLLWDGPPLLLRRRYAGGVP